MIGSYFKTMNFILRHCPALLVALFVMAHAAFWLTVFVYPVMAQTHYALWWRLVCGTFWVALASWPVCLVAAAAMARR